MNIYVGNLAFTTTDDELKALFENYGVVDRARVVLDRDTGRSRGFGFVEMANQDEGEEAIRQTDSTELSGRRIRVNEARPKPEGGSGGGPRRGGGGRERY